MKRSKNLLKLEFKEKFFKFKNKIIDLFKYKNIQNSDLERLMLLDDLSLKEIGELDTIAQEIWVKYVREDNLDYLKDYVRIKEKLANNFIKYAESFPQKKNFWKLQAAKYYAIVFQKKFEILQQENIQSDVRNNAEPGEAFSEEDSPYYNIKELIGRTKSIYDELAVDSCNKNDFINSRIYYSLLGETILEEIHYATIIGDFFLYNEEDVAFSYYNAAKAFLRCHKVLKEQYITTHHARLIYHNSKVSDLFGTGNDFQSAETLAILCFERAKDLFRKSGNRNYYLTCRDLLYELKSKNKDFEFNISRTFIKICRNFVRQKNFITSNIRNPKKIKEKDVRDYFLSHINVLIDDFAIAESVKVSGYSDLIILGKDYVRKFHEAVAEFKIWGRNSSHKEHSYKNVLNQLKGYMTEFESFGIVVMLNPNKNPIKDKYIKEIIEKDRNYIKKSLEEPFDEGSFINLKSKHYVKNDRKRTISIYHFVINIHDLIV